MNKWKDIWNKEDRVQNIILEVLIKVNGYNDEAGSFSVEDWLAYTHSVYYEQIKIDQDSSVFDVGSGCGAFLYPLFLKGHQVGGIDYSTVLIDIAKKFFPGSFFEVGEACDIKNNILYDVVLSHSVFHYFQNIEYAQLVIDNMIKKARDKIVILDINDIEKKEIYIDMRKKTMSEEEYKQKYNGLDHMFYSKQWFYDIAKSNNLTIHIENQAVKNYGNSDLRFNVFLEKND